MKYLKYFEQASAYEAYKNGSDFVTPNVSYVVENDIVNYNPLDANSSSKYVMVDLGLPSGLLWADRNVGAIGPEDAGLYFQWGDKVGYTVEQATNGEKVFDWNNYWNTSDGGNTFNKYDPINHNTLDVSDDAAAIYMGSEYRMPTLADVEELVNNCTVTFIDIDGIEHSQNDLMSSEPEGPFLKGIKITGSNGNSIFIPAAGKFYLDSNDYINFGGFIWTASHYYDDYICAFILNFNVYGSFETYNTSDFCNGLSVRGVK